MDHIQITFSRNLSARKRAGIRWLNTVTVPATIPVVTIVVSVPIAVAIALVVIAVVSVTAALLSSALIPVTASTLLLVARVLWLVARDKGILSGLPVHVSTNVLYCAVVDRQTCILKVVLPGFRHGRQEHSLELLVGESVFIVRDIWELSCHSVGCS